MLLRCFLWSTRESSSTPLEWPTDTLRTTLLQMIIDGLSVACTSFNPSLLSLNRYSSCFLSFIFIHSPCKRHWWIDSWIIVLNWMKVTLAKIEWLNKCGWLARYSLKNKAWYDGNKEELLGAKRMGNEPTYLYLYTVSFKEERMSVITNALGNLLSTKHCQVVQSE